MKSESKKLFLGALLISISLFLSQPINYVGANYTPFESTFSYFIQHLSYLFLNMIFSLQIIPFVFGWIIILKRDKQ